MRRTEADVQIIIRAEQQCDQRGDPITVQSVQRS